MKRIHLIVNPVSGRGAGARAVPEIERLLTAHGVQATFSFTGNHGDALPLAAHAVKDGADIVAAVGGDGTINEVINGLRGSTAVLGIIPVGSGNDFVKVLGVPADLAAAVNLLVTGSVRRVDLGEVNGRLFANSLALGIDGAVAGTMNRARWLPPGLAYHFGVIFNVLFFRNVGVTWRSDSGEGHLRVNLASVMNGSTYGGSYQVAPPASIEDGLLDLVIVGDYGIPGRIMHLPKLKKGKHLGLSRVLHRRVAELEIRADRAIPVAVDGELIDVGLPGTSLRIRILPGALRVLAQG